MKKIKKNKNKNKKKKKIHLIIIIIEIIKIISLFLPLYQLNIYSYCKIRFNEAFKLNKLITIKLNIFAFSYSF